MTLDPDGTLVDGDSTGATVHPLLGLLGVGSLPLILRGGASLLTAEASTRPGRLDLELRDAADQPLRAYLERRTPDVRAFALTAHLAISYYPSESSADVGALLGALAAELEVRGEGADADAVAVGFQALADSGEPRNSGPGRGDPELTRRLERVRRTRTAEPVICTRPWTTMEVIDAVGDVHQCCTEWTTGRRGNIATDSVLDVWNGPGYRQARRDIRADRAAICRGICPRLHDAQLHEERFRIQPGSDAFIKNQLLVAEDIATGREVALGKPLELALLSSTYCNYDCVMCQYGRTPRRDLDDAIWGQVRELLPTLRHLTLLGGEPLANVGTRRFLREFDPVLFPDVRIDLVTNGSLLNDKVLGALRGVRFGAVTVSVNAATEDTYRAVQRADISLERLVTNIQGLLELRRDAPERFDVCLSFVVMPSNASELVAFGQMARELGVSIRLLPLTLGDAPELDFYEDEQALSDVGRHLQDFADWARDASPGWLSEIGAVQDAIRAESAGRLVTIGR